MVVQEWWRIVCHRAWQWAVVGAREKAQNVLATGFVAAGAVAVGGAGGVMSAVAYAAAAVVAAGMSAVADADAAVGN